MKRGAWFFLAAVGIGGCAGVGVYSDAALRNEAAFKLYPAKTYLLVVHQGGKAEVSVISLPDLSSPLYIKAKEGLGSANLSFTTTHGMLTTYGATVDSKLPELVTALGSLVAPVGQAPAALSPKPSPTDGATASFELYEIERLGTETVLRKVTIRP